MNGIEFRSTYERPVVAQPENSLFSRVVKAVCAFFERLAVAIFGYVNEVDDAVALTLNELQANLRSGLSSKISKIYLTPSSALKFNEELTKASKDFLTLVERSETSDEFLKAFEGLSADFKGKNVRVEVITSGGKKVDATYPLATLVVEGFDCSKLEMKRELGVGYRMPQIEVKGIYSLLANVDARTLLFPLVIGEYIEELNSPSTRDSAYANLEAKLARAEALSLFDGSDMDMFEESLQEAVLELVADGDVHAGGKLLKALKASPFDFDATGVENYFVHELTAQFFTQVFEIDGEDGNKDYSPAVESLKARLNELVGAKVLSGPDAVVQALSRQRGSAKYMALILPTG